MHLHTPCLWSPALSTPTRRVRLKMDALQPSGSFKLRGIGALCAQHAREGITAVVSSSGGNAGYATAWAAQQLGLQCTVVIPTTTPRWMAERVRHLSATVVVQGSVWDQAHAHAQTLAEGSTTALIHPFEHPTTWAGHGSLVKELVGDGPKPGAIVCSVGGGGLLCGILHGLEAVGWDDVPVVAVETEGAASLAAALQAKHLTTLPEITSIAKSLGARQVSPTALRWSMERPVHSWVCSDRDALDGVDALLAHHRVLVEPACGAALAAILRNCPALAQVDDVVVVVCGGSVVRPQDLVHWRSLVDKASSSS